MAKEFNLDEFIRKREKSTDYSLSALDALSILKSDSEKEKLPKVPLSLHIEGENYLGIYEPHNIRRYGKEIVSWTVAPMLRKSYELLEERMRGGKIIIGIEEGGKLSKSAKRAFARSMRGHADRGESFKLDEILMILAEISEEEKSPEIAYNLAVYGALSLLKDKLGYKNRVVVELEDVPFKGKRPVYDYYEVMKHSDSTMEARLQKASKLVEYIVLRDTKFAAQIGYKAEKEKTDALVMVRGTLHLGTVHALRHFNFGTVSDIDLEAPRLLRLNKNSASVIPLLWNRQFWDEVINGNNMSRETARTNALMKQQKDIQAVIAQDKWQGILRKGIERAERLPKKSDDEIILLS